MSAEGRMEFVVYLHGDLHFKESWYRVVLPLPPLKSNHQNSNRKILPVAWMDIFKYGELGGWDFIGDTIYWTGGCDFDRKEEPVFDKLMKHDTTISDPTHWVMESSTMKISHRTPFVAALCGGKQLCVVGGFELQVYRGQEPPLTQSTDSANPWVKLGEVYDFHKTSWTLLDANFYQISEHDVQISAVAVVENEEDGGEPTQLVFYDLNEGSFQFLDVANGGTLTGPFYHRYFSLWDLPSVRAPDLTDPILEDTMLGISIPDSRAVFAGNTFYWFTPVMILCGYDIVAQRWFLSQSLSSQFPRVLWVGECSMCPILLFVQKGLFLVVIPHKRGELTMAFLNVEKRESSYCVSVDHVPTFFFSDPSFVTRDAKAKL